MVPYGSSRASVTAGLGNVEDGVADGGGWLGVIVGGDLPLPAHLSAVPPWDSCWVCECAECGFVYKDHAVDGVAVELASLGARYASRLQVPAGAADCEESLRRRPEPEVWSALEYACHVRDVLLAQRERLFLALVEDCPSFAPIYPARRVELARYGSEDPARLGKELEIAAGLAARAFAGVDSVDWSRPCFYTYPSPARRSVAWLAQHTLHEGEHHLLDIDRIAGLS